MATLTRASQELFNRHPDERFESLQALCDFCQNSKQESQDRWHPPATVIPTAEEGRLILKAGHDGAYGLNDWSFTQLCRMAGVAKDTVNKVSALTAALVFKETMPHGDKPLQLLTTGDQVRSVHGTAYTRLWSSDLLNIVREFAVDFTPPQKGMNGATGLYAGQQDIFCFMLDPLGWVEIGTEAFAPGFFVWNSEVGKRTVGVSTFWYQAVCQNHIVWDATEVVEFTRKHTANVRDSLSEIRRIIEGLVERRDQRKDGFAAVIKRAMEAQLGEDAEKALAVLTKKGITRPLAKKALEMAQQQGRLSIWCVVDALTRLAQSSDFAGDRTEADEKASSLLSLV